MSVRKSFGALSRPTARISGRSRSTWSRARCARPRRRRSGSRPSARGARSCSEPRFALALRHADRHGRQRLDQPVDPPIEPGRDARVSRKRPAVHGEDPDRNPGDDGRRDDRARRPSSCSHAGCPVARGAAGAPARRGRRDRARDGSGAGRSAAEGNERPPSRRPRGAGPVRAPRPPRRTCRRAPGAAKRRRSARRRPRPA